MISCSDIYDEASARHDGDLSEAQRTEYDRHLEVCVQCGSFYRGFVATIDRARAAVRTEPPPELVEQLIRGFRAELERTG